PRNGAGRISRCGNEAHQSPEAAQRTGTDKVQSFDRRFHSGRQDRHGALTLDLRQQIRSKDSVFRNIDAIAGRKQDVIERLPTGVGFNGDMAVRLIGTDDFAADMDSDCMEAGLHPTGDAGPQAAYIEPPLQRQRETMDEARKLVQPIQRKWSDAGWSGDHLVREPDAVALVARTVRRSTEK